MNTRANSIIMMIFEIIVVLLVVGMTFFIATSLANSEGVQKIRFTKDISMLVNTMAGLPGDALVEFPQNTSQLGFVLNNAEMIGFLAKEKEMVERREHRKIYLPAGYTASGLVNGEQKICLQKEKKIIELKPCP